MRRQLVLLAASTTLLVLVAFLLPLAVLLRTLAVDRAVAQALQEAQGWRWSPRSPRPSSWVLPCPCSTRAAPAR